MALFAAGALVPDACPPLLAAKGRVSRQPMKRMEPILAPTSPGKTDPEAKTPPTKEPEQRFVLQGELKESVPRTPEDVTKYLRKMKVIIMSYEQVAASTLMGPGGLNMDVQSAETARQETLGLVSRIRAIVPPEELTDAHAALATAMGSVGVFLTAPASFDQMLKAISLIGEIRAALDRYHSGVSNCIAYYGLDAKLDPFSDEDPDLARKFAQSAEDLKKQKMAEFQQMVGGGAASGELPSLFFGENGLIGGGAGKNSRPGGNPGGLGRSSGSGGFFGSGGFAGTGSAGGLGPLGGLGDSPAAGGINLFGGAPGAGGLDLQGVDLNGLMRSLQGMIGGGGANESFQASPGVQGLNGDALKQFEQMMKGAGDGSGDQ